MSIDTIVHRFTSALHAQLRQPDNKTLPGTHIAELAAFATAVNALPDDDRRSFADALDETQTSSKLWLIGELSRHTELAGATVVVVGAWYGILPLLINWTVPVRPARMLCVDIDPAACALGRQVVGALYPNVEFEVADAMRLDYARLSPGRPPIVVNTICEHLPDVPGWWRLIPAGTLVAMQSNNYAACPDHVNWVPGVAAMKAQTPLSTVLFEGELPTSVLDRFMLIGRR